MSVLDMELESALGSNSYDQAGVPQAVPKGRIGRQLQYWKLCQLEDCTIHYQSKGWVVTGPALSPATATEWSQFMENKHATPLTKYGKWDNGEVFTAVNRFGPLIRGGGIREIPLEQMIAYKWHLKPDVVQAVPELADVVVLYCEHGCQTRGPRMRTFVTEEARTKHNKVMHQEIVGPTLIGKLMREAQSGPMAAMGPEFFAQLATTIAKALKEPVPTVVKGGSSD